MALSHRQDDGLASWTLVLAFIIAGLFLIISRDDARLRQSGYDAVDGTLSPAAALLSKPLRSAENVIFGVQDRARAFEENKALRAELTELREKQARMDVLTQKVQRYESILGATSDTDVPLQKIVARAVSETNGPFVQSVLINAGREQGVETGHAVMSADGLIGHIIRAGQNSSRVLLLGDLNSRIAVMSREGEARAIMAGDNQARPKLAYVNDQAVWAEGDQVMTSGDEGVLPRGLFVGEVIAGPSGEWRVKLGAEKAALDWVWVSPYRPIEAPAEAPVDIDPAPETDAPDAPPSEGE